MADTFDKASMIKTLNFGERIAEEETDNLKSYFVETEQWRQLYSGSVDIIYGPKGAGKSALYSLIMAKEDDLFDRGIIIVPAENAKGSTAFANIKSEPPTTEDEFTGLWKLYFLCLLTGQLASYDISTKDAKSLYELLGNAGLIKTHKKQNLKALLLSVRDYVKQLMNAESVEAGLTVDAASGSAGINCKITLREPSEREREQGLISVDELLGVANLVLESQNLTAWILLDRLDAAFQQDEKLEYSALRALFRAYLDLVNLTHIQVKVFLRTDIWNQITSGGFREASHITRSLTISWSRQSLLNLVIKRFLANPTLCAYYDLDANSVYADINAQESLITRLLPDQVDAGRNLKTFEWMLVRTQDGTKRTAPRELIHLLSSLKQVQVERLDIGHPPPSEDTLFDRGVFKDALTIVSEERLTKTLYAEYSQLKPYIEKPREEKTLQTQSSLARIWSIEPGETGEIARRLVEIGLFENKGDKSNPSYWVPFLYRDALSLVQGGAQ